MDNLMRKVISKIPKERQIEIAATIASDNYNTLVALNNRGETPGIVESIKMIPYNFIGQFIPEDILKEGKKKHAERLEHLYEAMEKELKGIRISMYAT